MPWAQLHEDARGIAAALQARGVEPGDHVAILGPTTPAARHHDPGDLARGRHGRVPAAADATRARSRSSSTQTRLRIVNADAARARRRPRARSRSSRPSRATRRSCGSPSCAATRAGVGAPARRPRARSAILQFTSGSTADPKGVMLPHRCLIANIDAIVEGAALDHRGRRRVVAAAVPRHGAHRAADDADAHRLRARARARRRTSSPRPATGCGGCRSSAARSPAGRTSRTRSRRARMRRLDGLDLSHWRLALNGAEPIDPASVEAFLDAGARHGLAGDDAVLRVRHGRGDARHLVPRAAAGHERRHRRPDGARARALRGARPTTDRGASDSPLLGRTLRGIELRVCDPDTGRDARRPRGRRARAARHVGDARLLGGATTSPPRRSATGGCAPATSGTSSTARSSCAGASRT